MNTSEENREDKYRWAAYRKSFRNKVPDGCPDPNDLAAYIDGRAPAGKIPEIEAHLARCETCLETVLETRALARKKLPSAPDSLRERARELVDNGRRTEGNFPVLSGLRRISAWAAAAGVILAAGLGGFYLGRDLGIRQKELDETPFLFPDRAEPGWGTGESRGGES